MDPPTNPLQLFMWRDVFALLDRGQARPSDYEALGQLVIAESRRFPRGVGALIIIPTDASPPRDDSRVAMNHVMRELGGALRCLCWLVEGSGFQGAMARAVLTGLKTFGRFPYPCHVSSNMTEALGWLLKEIDGGDRRAEDVDEAVRAFDVQRRSPLIPQIPASSRRGRER